MEITDISGTVRLNNGIHIPYLGLGVYLAPDGEEVIRAIKWAMEFGYRHIDTASFYRNEEGVGQAVRESGIDRSDIFVTSKVWNDDQGYDRTLRAFDATMDRLGFDYLDLYLVHWPVKGKYKETWRALEEIYQSGRVRAIGVSNFLKHHLDDLLQSANVIPTINQVEFHPYLVQQPLVDYCHAHEVQFQAWSPLMRGKIFELPLMKEMAEKYNRTIAQVVLRWNLQKGVVTIPKSTKQHRIIENGQLFDFEISKEDVGRIDGLDCGQRIGPHPDIFV